MFNLLRDDPIQFPSTDCVWFTFPRNFYLVNVIKFNLPGTR